MRAWLLTVLWQTGWEAYNSVGTTFYGNASLKLHQWVRPQALFLEVPPAGHDDNHHHHPLTVVTDSLNKMLSKYTYCPWKMELQVCTGWKHYSWSWIILADSTIMEAYHDNHLVQYDQHLLGLALGGYGCGFFDGSFDNLKDWIKASLAPPHPQELVIAYVPAEDFKSDSYDEHATSQRVNLGNTCIRTPTIDDFAKAYFEMTGEEMIHSQGSHLTKRGCPWFAVALQRWARANGVQLVLCVGWNAGNCKKNNVASQINEEYRRQKSLVDDILSSVAQ